MKTIQGPGLFLAQFIGLQAPFDSLGGLAGWAAELGFKSLQIPTTSPAIFDLKRAAHSQEYCDEVRALLAGHGLTISELSTHLQGQLVAVHPAYDPAFDGFAPVQVRGNPQARQAWATEQLLMAAQASQRLGLAAHVTFSGALAWPYFYPWPPHNALLLEEAFGQLAQRWRPILDAFDDVGVDLCYELHPGEDLHDGVTFERFLRQVGNHPRCHILYDPAICICSRWTILALLMFITRASGHFTSRMLNIGPVLAAACTAVISRGWKDQDAFDHSAMGRSTSRQFSASWRSTIFPAGPRWSGSAV